MRKQSDELIESRVRHLRGRKHSPERVAAMSKRQTGKRHSQQTINKLKALYPNGVIARLTPQQEAMRRRAVSTSVAVKLAAKKNQQLAAGVAVETRPELYGLQAGNGHVAAKAWSIRDPLGVVHRFKNLNYFIRENAHLFEPDDIRWSGCRGNWCRASCGIKAMRPYRRGKILASWKGWTWVTLDERVLNNGYDLMGRGEFSPTTNQTKQ